MSCPCIIYQECNGLRHQIQNAMKDYISCRKNLQHCGEIIPIDLLKLEQNETVLSEEIAPCRCQEIKSNFLNSSTTTTTTSNSSSSTSPLPPPRQWIIPALFLTELNLSKNEFFIIASYDTSKSLLFNSDNNNITESSSTSSCSSSIVIVVKLSEFSEYLYNESISHNLKKITKQDIDDDGEKCRIISLLRSKIIPRLYNGLSRHIDVASSSPYRDLLTSMAPCTDALLSPSHALLPGGRFECYGPGLFWQVVCFLTCCFYVTEQNNNRNQNLDLKTVILTILRKSDPLGILHDDAALLQKAIDSFVSLLPQLQHACLSDDENSPTEEVSKWFDQNLNVAELILPLLLNCRITVGSTTASARGILFRPPHELVLAFTQRHALDQIFSVGARALAKHNHRDESANWWNQGTGGATVLKGSQVEKNRAALIVLYRKILSDIEWCNVHMLPHDVVTMEIRCKAGYGARWVATNVAVVPAMSPNTNSNNGATTTTNANDDDDDDNEENHQPDSPVLSIVPFWIDRGMMRNNGNNNNTTCCSAVLNWNCQNNKNLNNNRRRVTEFRGFLEPHEEDGHEKGWRH